MLSNMTQELLKTYLDYSPDTGLFTWKVQKSNIIKIGQVAGHVSSGGYVCIALNRKIYKAHRLAWLYVYGIWPKGEIDHINGQHSDNRLENLRDATKIENMRNMPMQKSNTSGVVGVNFSKKRGKWIARIATNDTRLYLGAYSVFEDACNARKRAEVLYDYHKNHGRNSTITVGQQKEVFNASTTN